VHLPHRFNVATALAAALAIFAPSTASADATGSEMVGWLNAQRAANGLPAAVAEDPAQSQSCLDYVRRVPGARPLDPFLTYAAPGSALTPPSGPWTATRNPFEQSPYALALLLTPRLSHVGAAEEQGAGCVTAASYGSPAPAMDITYTYPGAGATDWWTSQLIKELEHGDGPPPAPRETGPYLYVSFDGPDFDVDAPGATHATAASLTGPDGQVAVEARDSTTPYSATGVPSHVQLVPHDPLKPFAHYTASITAEVAPAAGDAARRFTKTWSFTTGALENAIAQPFVAGNVFRADPSSYFVEIYSRAPHVTVTATGPGTTATGSGDNPIGTYIGAGINLHLDQPGIWHFCARSGGDGTDFRPASYCWDAMGGAAPKPPVVAAPPKPAKLKV
jgi:hypothetical protein